MVVVAVLAFGASCYADTGVELNSFFEKSRKTRAGNMSLSMLVVSFSRASDADKRNLRSVIVGQGATWASELKAIAAKAGDTTVEKTLVAEMKRAHGALMTASTDPIKADEALRALVSLKARVPVVKGGTALDW